MTIPYRERGYSVEPMTLIVHERYQQHALDVRRTTPAGMYSMTAGAGTPCSLCFPPPVEPKRSARIPKPELVVVGEVGPEVFMPYDQVVEIEATPEEEARRTEADET